MEPRNTKGKRPLPSEDFKGFEVTQVVGKVVPGDGDHNPHETAFLMVARLDMPGTYVWVNNGHKVELTVDYPDTDTGVGTYPVDTHL